MQISLYVCETKSAKSGLITCISSIGYLYYADHSRKLLPRSAFTCTISNFHEAFLFQYYSYMPKICFKNCRICMFSIELGNHIFVSVLIIYLRMTLTLFGIEAFPILPITWVILVYFGQQIVIKWLLMSLSCKFKFDRPQQNGKNIRWFITIINDHANWGTFRDYMPLFPAIIPSEILLQHRVIDGWFVTKSFWFSLEMVTKNCTLTLELIFNQKSVMLPLIEKKSILNSFFCI